MSNKEKRLVESVLFSASKPVSVNEIKEVTGLTSNKIKKTMEELIEDYNVSRKNETSMEVVKQAISTQCRSKNSSQINRSWLQDLKSKVIF